MPNPFVDSEVEPKAEILTAKKTVAALVFEDSLLPEYPRFEDNFDLGVDRRYSIHSTSTTVTDGMPDVEILADYILGGLGGSDDSFEQVLQQSGSLDSDILLQLSLSLLSRDYQGSATYVPRTLPFLGNAVKSMLVHGSYESAAVLASNMRQKSFLGLYVLRKKISELAMECSKTGLGAFCDVHLKGCMSTSLSVLFEVIVDVAIGGGSREDLVRVAAAFASRDSCRLDVNSTVQLMKALSRSKEITACESVFRRASDDHVGNEFLYGCLLDTYVSNSRLEDAQVVFDEARRVGIKNTVVYSTLIKGCAQHRRLDLALKFYNEMIQEGIPLNTVTYNGVINACARVGAMDHAALVLEDMQQAGVEADMITYSTIIKGYCIGRNMPRALELLEVMRTRGFKPDGILYNSLLDGCVRVGDVKLCERLFRKMQENQIPPSNFTLSILIKLFGRIGMMDRAFQLVKEIPEHYNFVVNEHVHTCLMSASIANNLPDDAVEVFRNMIRSGLLPDVRALNTLILGLLRLNRAEQAAEVFLFGLAVPGSAFDRDCSDAKPSRRNDCLDRLSKRTVKVLWEGLMNTSPDFVAHTVARINSCNYHRVLELVPTQFGGSFHLQRARWKGNTRIDHDSRACTM
ncbi:MAG: uncharacterized protein KVP18_004123 [Porospora cf. gigantea A]|uniref:uncharacterized protein n=3 Tax=Porospora cf. gigantea A TaxID=2853593 RepID=UPI003559C8D3|nr:MAG: hypothetical protein KVP18_004123 [Porospora cf. gigantea A]